MLRFLQEKLPFFMASYSPSEKESSLYTIISLTGNQETQGSVSSLAQPDRWQKGIENQSSKP